jgi:hypothetical protein
MVLVDELGAGSFIADGAPLDEACLAAGDIRPIEGANGLHRQLSAHVVISS